jgi:hypothetical protein
MAEKISIIVINYKSKKNLLLCLKSLEKFLIGLSYEIIIVNNDKEESLGEIRESFSEVKIIEQNKNIGFGCAVNAGAKIAEGEILFFLNPDTEMVAGKLQDIGNQFIDNEKAGTSGCRIVDARGQTQPWISGVKKDFWDLLKNNLGLRKSQKIWEARKKIEADWVAATAMFIKKDLFDRLGGFDENIFIYFEDVDLCERARGLGKKVIYFPEFVVKHISGASFENKKNQKRYYHISQEYFFQKHCQKWEATIIKLIGKIFYAL